MDDVHKFVTYKERLEKAGASMTLAYYDYRENTGSSDVDWFWENFQEKRRAYIAIKDEFKEDEHC